MSRDPRDGHDPGGVDARDDVAAASGTPGVELSGVSVGYDGVTALEDATLRVADGEFFTLVGPSGCGKTTTLRTIAGFEAPASGRVAIGGEDVTGRPPEERNVGLVFQSYALFPHMTVRENVAYGLRFRDPPGGTSADVRVEELLDLVDMGGMADREPETLSGGQQQRIALARALAPGPEVLLLDEPLSALDAKLRQRLRLGVREIQRELGITTVYVTHDQAEALAISDRVAVMNDGRVEQVGSPEEVYREPASRFVAEFVGDNNLLDAEVTSRDPPVASVDGIEVRLPEGADVAVGDRVTLAVRPESIRFGAGETTIPATVRAAEYQGDAYRVHCEWAGRSVLVKTGPTVPPTDEVDLGFDAEDVRVV